MSLESAWSRARQVYGVVAVAVALGLTVQWLAWTRSAQASEVSSVGVLVSWGVAGAVVFTLAKEAHQRLFTRFLLVDAR